MTKESKRQAGFSLLELVVVLCILICLLALLYPKLWPVIQKKKLLKATNECRAVSIAFMEYALFYGGAASLDNPVDVADYGTVHPAADVQSFLTPDFISSVPVVDPWGQLWEYYYTAGPGPGSAPAVMGPHVYLIRSFGPNGIADGLSYVPGMFAPNLSPGDPGFTGDDIVCADGEAVRWPGMYAPVP